MINAFLVMYSTSTLLRIGMDLVMYEYIIEDRNGSCYVRVHY